MKTQQDVRVTVRVDKELKESADVLFHNLGMNMSVAFNVFLRKSIDEQAIPFRVGLNSYTYAGNYTPNEITQAFQKMVAEEINANRYDGHPIAQYDADNNKAYLEYPDGTKEYIGDE